MIEHLNSYNDDNEMTNYSSYTNDWIAVRGASRRYRVYLIRLNPVHYR